MPKITTPVIAATVATKLAAPGATQIALRGALQSIEDQRREGKTDAHEALQSLFATVESQRKAG